MKILVTVKRVIDYKTSIRIKPDQSGIETAYVKMSMNPFDEIALEEALRIKEKGMAKEIIAVSIGNEHCQETLRTALAMGADRAILVNTEGDVQPLIAAKIFKKIVEQESSQLVILGKQAIDTDNNQVGQILAGLLNWAQGTFISKLEFQANQVRVTREIDGGLEILLLTLPAVITTDLRLNEPRYISLPNIVQAKHKPLEVIPFASLNIDLANQVRVLKVTAPVKKRARIKVENVAELVRRLKTDERVI